MRYYYTDPLKAAWMARHFGMRFVVSKERNTWTNCTNVILARSEDQIIKDSCDWEVHPDSYEIIEPKDWDLGRYAGTYPYAYFKENGWFEQNERGSKPEHSIEITRRKNKAFFMPQSKE